MISHWEYDKRSAHALQVFESCVSNKMESLDRSEDFRHNKFNVLKKSLRKETEVFHTSYQSVETIEGAFQEGDLNVTKGTIPDEDIEDVVNQVLEDFKNCDGIKVAVIEMIFSHNNIKGIMKMLSEKATDSLVFNFCKLCSDCDEEFTSKHTELILKQFLLPTMLRIGHTKQMEYALFECFKIADYIKITKEIFLPLLLTETCLFPITSMIGKLENSMQIYILMTYFENTDIMHAWVLNTILLLFKSLDVNSSTICLFEKTVIFLNKGCLEFKSDLNFGKLLHATVSLLYKNKIPLSNEYLNMLSQVVHKIETPYKNSCIKMLNE